MQTSPLRPSFSSFSSFSRWLPLAAAASLAFAPVLAFAEDEEEPPEPNYVYRAEFVRIVDGDRLALDIDLGFSVWLRNQAIPLLDAGGDGQDETQRARDPERIKKLRELLVGVEYLTIRTVRDREANPPRFLATVWADEVNINAAMRDAFPD